MSEHGLIVWRESDDGDYEMGVAFFDKGWWLVDVGDFVYTLNFHQPFDFPFLILGVL